MKSISSFLITSKTVESDFNIPKGNEASQKLEEISSATKKEK
jgi:hypothetical protein